MQDDLSLQKGVEVCGMSFVFLRAFVIGLPLHVIIRVLYWSVCTMQHVLVSHHLVFQALYSFFAPKNSIPEKRKNRH